MRPAKITKNGRRVGRPPSCECGTCGKCLRLAAQRDAWDAMSPAERRAVVEARSTAKVRAADRARYRRQRPERLRAGREYDQSPEGRARHNASKARWQVANPEKRAAHEAVRRAVASGELVKGACESEGPACRGRIEAHHDDYALPLAVRWLCDHHHKAAHGWTIEERDRAA